MRIVNAANNFQLIWLPVTIWPSLSGSSLRWTDFYQELHSYNPATSPEDTTVRELVLRSPKGLFSRYFAPISKHDVSTFSISVAPFTSTGWIPIVSAMGQCVRVLAPLSGIPDELLQNSLLDGTPVPPPCLTPSRSPLASTPSITTPFSNSSPVLSGFHRETPAIPHATPQMSTSFPDLLPTRVRSIHKSTKLGRGDVTKHNWIDSPDFAEIVQAIHTTHNVYAIYRAKSQLTYFVLTSRHSWLRNLPTIKILDVSSYVPFTEIVHCATRAETRQIYEFFRPQTKDPEKLVVVNPHFAFFRDPAPDLLHASLCLLLDEAASTASSTTTTYA